MGARKRVRPWEGRLRAGPPPTPVRTFTHEEREALLQQMIATRRIPVVQPETQKGK